MIKNIMSLILLIKITVPTLMVGMEHTSTHNLNAQVKHVFFDWNGVCTKESNYQGLKYLRQQYGTKTALLFPMRILQALTHKNLLKDVYRLIKLKVKTADSFWDIIDYYMPGFGQQWRCFWQGRNTPNDPIFELIKELETHNLKVHILSNGLTPKAFEELKKDRRFKKYTNDPLLKTFFESNSINRSQADATQDSKTGTYYYTIRKPYQAAYDTALENITHDNEGHENFTPPTPSNSIMIDNSAKKLPTVTNKKYTGTPWLSSILYKDVASTRSQLKKLGALQ